MSTFDQVFTGVLFVAACIACACVGHCSTKEYYRGQAVRHGCGVFAVEDSTRGNMEFQWKKSEQKKPATPEQP